MVESGGHTVVGFGAEPVGALADLSRLAPDLLLLDLSLAHGSSGLDLPNDMRRCRLKVRTVVLTVAASSGWRRCPSSR